METQIYAGVLTERKVCGLIQEQEKISKGKEKLKENRRKNQ